MLLHALLTTKMVQRSCVHNEPKECRKVFQRNADDSCKPSTLAGIPA